MNQLIFKRNTVNLYHKNTLIWNRPIEPFICYDKNIGESNVKGPLCLKTYSINIL